MNKKIAILGAGESGIGTAILASAKGYAIWLSDAGSIKDEYKEELHSAGLGFEECGHNLNEILSADLVMKSPGIPETAEVMIAIRQAGIPVVSEIEFAAKFTDAKLIGITGTNGKTTTTLLTYHLLKSGGLKVAVAGNIGKSFARLVANEEHDKPDYYVLEISSFQLDDMHQAKLDIAILTNITPDHLDRYNYNIEEYMASKLRIIQNQTNKDAFIYCLDDALTMKALANTTIEAQSYPFSLHKDPKAAAYIDQDRLIINTKNDIMDMPTNDLSLKGKHNQYNSMAAGISARLVDLRKDAIRQSLSDFENVEHRLEFVASIRGVDYYNDSKATNVNSTWYSLESMAKPTIWIVGGVDKGNDYASLLELVKDKVKAIVCLGKDNLRIHEAFGAHVDLLVNTMSMEEAVKMSHHLSSKGDAVLLSPACASFDLFDNYEDRGRQFKKYVKAL